MCKLNPKVDFAFKRLFGSEGNKDLLISLINSLMAEEEQIKDIILKNPYNLVNYKKGKMTILDIKAVDDKGIWYDIEMQMAEQTFYDKRAFYYWAKTYVDQIESGEDFDSLRKTIVISILDFNYLEEEAYHNIIKPFNAKSKKQFSDLLELHFVELSKFKKEYKELKTKLDKWAAFLNKAYEIEKDKIPEVLDEEESIRKAIEQLDIMYLNSEEREIYEAELNFLRVHKAEMKSAEMKGREEGREEGKIEIAKSALLMNLSMEQIIKLTGLSEEKIRKL